MEWFTSVDRFPLKALTNDLATMFSIETVEVSLHIHYFLAWKAHACSCIHAWYPHLVTLCKTNTIFAHLSFCHVLSSQSIYFQTLVLESWHPACFRALPVAIRFFFCLFFYKLENGIDIKLTCAEAGSCLTHAGCQLMMTRVGRYLYWSILSQFVCVSHSFFFFCIHLSQ